MGYLVSLLHVILLWNFFFSFLSTFQPAQKWKRLTSEVSQHSHQPNSLAPHLLMTNKPWKLRDPAPEFPTQKPGHACARWKPLWICTLPVFPTTAHFCMCLIKSDVWNTLLKSTDPLACIYLLWSSLRPELSRRLFLWQFTTASNFHRAVESNAVTSVACGPDCLFTDDFTA